MAEHPRIVLIHATRVAITPIEAAFAELWPEAETVSILEEGLALDLAQGRASRGALDHRINALADYAMGLGPDALLYTCSAFGTGIERAAARLALPVLKPNEAMFDAALAVGARITMLYTFPPAAEGMEEEFRTAAGAAGKPAQITSVFVPDALDLLKSGDKAAHDALIAEAAKGLPACDAVLLAHFSMTSAAEGVRAVTSVPVLTSPETAVNALRHRLAVGAAR
ncbi:hypothetical protein PVT71_20290 [Salipiger sp. H15]|uniref:Arylsulfatase n=1 Tax=Alloyangia sp. H15 TaxID=3029062 RepID=A0AAU8ALZ4_9RHOB